MKMTCSNCRGDVLWVGPMANLTHTKCQQCGSINSQTYAHEETDEPMTGDASMGCGEGPAGETDEY